MHNSIEYFKFHFVVLQLPDNNFLELFFWTEEVLVKNVFRFLLISGPTGSGKPDASIQGESLGQEESNDTSIVPIGPAVPRTSTLATPILIRYLPTS